MEEAGRIAAKTHDHLTSRIEAGRTTDELDDWAEEFIRNEGALPAFHDYEGMSNATTISVNEDLIHSPPSSNEVLEPGDLVSIDLGAKYRGHYSDTARTHIVESALSEDHEELVNRTQSALYAGILSATAGNTLRDVGRAIESRSGSYGLVTGWAGHFIGRELHLAPQVHNVADRNESFQLERGMYLAIEPILTLSEDAGTLRASGERTIRSRSGAFGAHFEHTVRVGRDRVELLTARSDEPEIL
jgi:methionyl aminopeptidase